MKKTAISLLLAVAMVFSLVLVAAPAAQAADHTAHCVCGGSCTVGGHTHDTNVTWTKWEATDTLPTATGNYYLDANVTLTARAEIAGDVVLCLNGKTVTSTGEVALLKMLADSKLTITDCTGTGVMTNTTAPSKSGGLIYNDQVATLNIYGGTLTAPNDATAGGCIYWGSGTLNIYGGTINGGKVTNRGGALNIAGTTPATGADFGTVVNMYGGTVKGGENTNVNEANGGGAIRIGGNNGGDKTSVFNLYGGVVDGGKSAGYGGSIYIQQPNNVLNLYGGTVKNGEATTAGKDIYATKGAKVVVKKINVGVTVTKGTDDATIDVSALDASLKATQNEKVFTIATKTAGGSNPSTGDSANLVVMGLGLVLGVAGMACLLPKKQKV